MNTSLMSLFGLGLLLGIKHAFDADHIAAMATFDSKNSVCKGFFWGIGHTFSLLAVGFIVLLFKITIPETLALSFEFIVGVMLALLGLNVLISIKKNKLHLHKHNHAGKEHMHLHSHLDGKSHSHDHRPFMIGLVHGLAGSAALILLVLSTIDSVFMGILYILVFGAGSIIGMTAISKVISLPFKYMANMLHKTDKMLRLAAGFVSLAFGISIMYNTIILF